MDDVDKQIHALRNHWQAEDLAQEERIREAQRVKLEKARTRLQNREWKPDCICDQCLRAVFEMTAPDGLCPQARKMSKFW